MKKLAGPLALVLMVVLCIGSWSKILTMDDDKAKAYQSCIAQAEKYTQKKIYIDAIASYREALKLQPENLDLVYQIADLYEKLGETENYHSTLREILQKNPGDMAAYDVLLQASLDEKEYDMAYHYAKAALAQDSCEEEWQTKMNAYIDLLHTMTDSRRYLSFETIQAYFHPSDGSAASAVVQAEGKYGVIGLDGEYLLEPEYEDAGVLGSGYFPVCQDGEYFYVDKNAYRRKVPDYAVTWLGSFSEGYAPFQQGETNADGSKADNAGKYGYLDVNLNHTVAAYDYAGGFYHDRAAVQQDGKWMLIDKEFQQVGSESFAEILVDENGFCSQHGVFWAKVGDRYYLYNLDAQRISEIGFSSVKLFASEQPCAVQLADGSWGFITKDGTVQDALTYADAESYCLGYAPVQPEDSGWRLANPQGMYMLEEEFSEMRPLDADGSFLAVSEDVLTRIWMHRYED